MPLCAGITSSYAQRPLLVIAVWLLHFQSYHTAWDVSVFIAVLAVVNDTNIVGLSGGSAAEGGGLPDVCSFRTHGFCFRGSEEVWWSGASALHEGEPVARILSRGAYLSLWSTSLSSLLVQPAAVALRLFLPVPRAGTLASITSSTTQAGGALVELLNAATV
eukprot:TRINITY_DN23119_c0_g2_i4.p1 TRINITY_DN23119_c0_g2~~TRINITY_DN23119_c0_g2_i4.p1  ORF type:complete len:162 (-),score=7.14 TRINITY_DN23119_c0_g2_i4:191-676(-)